MRTETGNGRPGWSTALCRRHSLVGFVPSEVFHQMIKENPKQFGKVKPVFDGNKNMYCMKELDLDGDTVGLQSSLYTTDIYKLGLWLRLECSLDSLSIDSAHVIYVSEGYDVAYNRRTASQPSYVVLRVTWYVKTFRNVNYVC